jgi:hypothetical protein
MSLSAQDLDGLRDLQAKADEFTQAVFDWVAPLDQRHLLSHLYDFKARIDEAVKEIEAGNDTRS